jgi:hypothetical protein
MYEKYKKYQELLSKYSAPGGVTTELDDSSSVTISKST